MKTTNTANRLRQIMSERGLRQVDILALAQPHCDKYGVKLGRNDLSQYVSGKVESGQEKLTVLGLALGVSETWLMGYDVVEERNALPSNLISLQRIARLHGFRGFPALVQHSVSQIKKGDEAIAVHHCK